jgi:hypothetical protein
MRKKNNTGCLQGAKDLPGTDREKIFLRVVASTQKPKPLKTSKRRAL